MALKAPALTAEALAELCLAHLAQDPELLAEFMRASGLSPDGLRRAVGTPGLIAGLIDHFAQNEPLLLALCAENRLKPESVMRVWHKLNPSG